MSFFSYQHNAGAARPSAEPKPEEMKVPPHMVIIDGKDLIKLVEDNPEIPEGKTDVGLGMVGHWQPVNYNPETGEML